MYRARMDGSHGQARQRTTRQAYGTVLVLAFLTVATVQNGALSFLVGRVARRQAPNPPASSGDSKLTVGQMKEVLKAKGENMMLSMIEQLETEMLQDQQQVSEEAPMNGEVPPVQDAEAEDMFAQLTQLDSGSAREDYFDSESGEWDKEGLQEDLSLAKQKVEAAPKEAEAVPEATVEQAAPAEAEAVAEATVEQAPPAQNEEAEELLAQLRQLEAGVEKEDYFDPDQGAWDLAGLQDDLSLAQKQQQPAAPPAQDLPAVPAAAAPSKEEASGESQKAEAMFAELKQLDSNAEKEDYFDSESGEWDADGLQDDLTLAQQNASSAPAPEEIKEVPQAPQKEEAPSHNEEAEQMFAQLQKEDPGVEKEDYYDSDSGEWDMVGLQEDLGLSQQRQQPSPATPAPAVESPKAEAAGADAGDSPQSMLEELMRYDPGVSKEDYYSEEADEWDLDGLRDDLELASKSTGSSPAKEAEAAPAPVAAVAAEAEADDGEAFSLWAELTKLDSEASKEDYFDDESGEWDLQGLQDDLTLARQAQGGGGEAAAVPEVEPTPAPPAAAAAEAGDGDAFALWAELSKLDGEASKEDYFDEESGEWDVQGLQDDLTLAQQAQGSGGEAAAAPEAAPAAGSEVQAAPVQQEGTLEDPEALLAHLSTFDPKVTKQDYFDDGEWDVEGLKEDLRLAKEGVVASVQAQQSPAEVPAAAAAVAVAAAAAPAQAEAAAEPKEAKAEETIAVGDYVLAKYEGDGAGWYTAVVIKDQGGGSFTLKWDEDTTEETVVREKIKLLPPIIVNAKVSAIWEEDGGWYDAVVLRAGEAGTFVVKYDEDSSQATLPKEKIRMKVEPPAEPQYWAAPYEEGDEAPAAGEEIQACWKDGDYEGYHSAKMVKDNGDGTYLVKWDEDSSQTSVKKEEIRKSKAKVPLSELHPGQKFVGIVTNLTEYGAFVNIGVDSSSDGLVHISRLSKRRVDNVEDVVSVGQVVTVWVSRIKDDGKYDLSMVEGRLDGGVRQEADYSAFADVDTSTLLKATVTGVQAYGIFVEVHPPDGSPQQRGFVHCSEIRDGYIEDAAEEQVEVGQEVQVRLLEVDKERNSLRLTMKPA